MPNVILSLIVLITSNQKDKFKNSPNYFLVRMLFKLFSGNGHTKNRIIINALSKFLKNDLTLNTKIQNTRFYE